MPPSFDPDLRHCAERLAAQPTAPYHEQFVRAEVEALLAGLPHVSVRRDTFGNVLAHYRHKPRPGAAFAMVAHMDHPGCHVPEGARGRTAQFLGGVAEANFAGASVTWFRDDSVDPLDATRVESTAFKPDAKTVTFDRELPSGARFGMWSLPAYRFTPDRFLCRACDDLVQVATMTALLRRLAREEVAAEVYALYTRTEELGFLGALASLEATPRVPAAVPILSLETSLARGFAKLGGGPILRVGDRSSIFHPEVTRWVREALDARDAAAAKKGAAPKPSYQRLLMAGGTCEATVFVQAGRPAGALCVALHNYHNMTVSGGIGLEAVHLADWQGLLDGLHVLATQAPPFRAKRAGLSAALDKLRRQALATLKG